MSFVDFNMRLDGLWAIGSALIYGVQCTNIITKHDMSAHVTSVYIKEDQESQASVILNR